MRTFQEYIEEARYRNDPCVMFAKFRGKCPETKKTINKGDEIVYFPDTKTAYHIDSKTAKDFLSRKHDMDMEDMGMNYVL